MTASGDDTIKFWDIQVQIKLPLCICVCMCGDPTCFRSVHLLARYGPPKNKNKVAKPLKMIIEHVSFVFEIRNVSAAMFHTMSL